MKGTPTQWQSWPAEAVERPPLRIDGRTIATFLAVAYLAAWLVCLPVWISPRHLSSPWVLPIGVVMMWTPALGAWLALRFVAHDDHPFRTLGLPVPRPVGRFVLYCGLGVAVLAGLVAAALVCSWALGEYHPDLVHYSGYAKVVHDEVARSGRDAPPIPIGLLAWLSLLNVVVGSVLNVPATLGEELGWRGLLLPWLRERLGPVGGVLATGVIWGLWHAPLVLLGYNYPGHAGWLALMVMCGFTTAVTVPLGWLRQRSASVWPAAFGHAAVNASAGWGVVFGSAAFPPDNLHSGILGWSGWPVALVLLVVLVLRHGYDRWHPAGWALPRSLRTVQQLTSGTMAP